MKADFLLKQFNDYGYTETTRIYQSELLLFPNRKSITRKFDENIIQKLFEFLSINEYNKCINHRRICQWNTAI